MQKFNHYIKFNCNVCLFVKQWFETSLEHTSEFVVCFRGSFLLLQFCNKSLIILDHLAGSTSTMNCKGQNWMKSNKYWLHVRSHKEWTLLQNLLLFLYSKFYIINVGYTTNSILATIIIIKNKIVYIKLLEQHIMN